MILAIAVGIAALSSIFAEFFLPGGVMAGIGALFFLFSILYSFTITPFFGVIWTIGLFLLLFLVIKIALFQVKRRSIYLKATQEGFIIKTPFYEKEYIGKIAVVVTDLKPSGYIEVDGVKCQAVSSGEYVRKGMKVKIVGERASHFLVN